MEATANKVDEIIRSCAWWTINYSYNDVLVVGSVLGCWELNEKRFKRGGKVFEVAASRERQGIMNKDGDAPTWAILSVSMNMGVVGKGSYVTGSVGQPSLC
jgi:hypothetical protein